MGYKQKNVQSKQNILIRTIEVDENTNHIIFPKMY